MLYARRFTVILNRLACHACSPMLVIRTHVTWQNRRAVALMRINGGPLGHKQKFLLLRGTLCHSYPPTLWVLSTSFIAMYSKSILHRREHALQPIKFVLQNNILYYQLIGNTFHFFQIPGKGPPSPSASLVFSIMHAAPLVRAFSIVLRINLILGRFVVHPNL